MATYYLSSTGSNTAPYDTEAKAATSMWTIRGVDGFVPTDTIILCSDVTDTTFGGALCQYLCNIEAKEGLQIRPKYTVDYVGGPLYAGNETFSISNIEFINKTPSAWSVTPDSDVTITNCIFRLPGQGYLLGTYEKCLISINADNTTLGGALVGVKFHADRCTIIDYRSTLNTQWLINGSGNDLVITNCIFYDNMGSSSRAIIILANDVGQVANIHDNIYYTTTTLPNSVNPWSTAVPLFIGVGNGSINNGVNNTKTDPLFLENVNYTLKRISPALKAGVGSVNIGWDQVTVGLPADAPLGLVTSTPTKSYAGDLLSDSDNGGGIDTTNTNDYSSGLYNLGNLRR